MEQLRQMFDDLKESGKYRENAQMLTKFLDSLNQGKKRSSKEDLDAIRNFIFGEMEKLIQLIPKIADYKSKDEIFDYEDKLIGLFTHLLQNKYDIGQSEFDIVKTLGNMVDKEQSLEVAINAMFELDKIQKSDVIKLIDIVKPITDEYRRGVLYSGLLHFKTLTDKITDEAKDEFALHFEEEFARYLKNKDSLSEDEINNLEIAVDVCKYFVNSKIGALLKEILQLKHNNIRYYAIETLLLCKQPLEPQLIAEMAADLTYADLTYALLKRYKQANLFPKEFTSPEYLAKSDLIHWLTYPTELNKVPDEIEQLGSIKCKGSLYYIFKYKSDSDTLDEDTKNKWLIGWSSSNGGTFSNFDELSKYEQKDLKSTLKFIKKKLL